MALALWGLQGWTASAVRARVSDVPQRGFGEPGWRCLARWAGDVAKGALFPLLALGLIDAKPRAVAARAAQTLCGHTPREWREGAVEEQAFAGASHVS